jgi:hydroxyethylthiazole kinase-like uncharacterized protein yjeF
MARVPVLTTEELRAVEAAGAHAVPPLMELAGRAVAKEARHLASGRDGAVVVVAGPGNNGGDAWVAARELAASGVAVIVHDVTGALPRAPEAREARTALLDRGVTVVREWPMARPAAVIDGLLGIGIARDVDPAFAAVIARINASGAPVLAIDVPSGLDSATGAVRGSAVRATRTITFLAHKAGLHTFDGPDHCGDVVLDELGQGDACRGVGQGELLAPALLAGWIPQRPRNAHKGLFGTLGIIGGAHGLLGAAMLAGRAAVLCGAGKTRVALLEQALPVDPLQPEIMMSSVEAALEADVLVVGPGGGASTTALAQAIALDKPLVVDADALNAVAREASLAQAIRARKAPTLATPHPGEAARLLACDNASVQRDRRDAALRIASRLNAHVVLKGAGSICASPTGDWAVNTTGNAGLASGGTGDVLAGMLGALLAQRLDPWRALRYAVCLHGAAADALTARGVGPIGLTASEVALEARTLLNRWP